MLQRMTSTLPPVVYKVVNGHLNIQYGFSFPSNPVLNLLGGQVDQNASVLLKIRTTKSPPMPKSQQQSEQCQQSVHLLGVRCLGQEEDITRCQHCPRLQRAPPSPSLLHPCLPLPSPLVDNFQQTSLPVQGLSQVSGA